MSRFTRTPTASGKSWNRRDDQDASRRTDFHFTLDATSGAIVFGDGERGRVPDAGATVLAIYRRTLAAQGNVLPSQITRITASAWNSVLLKPALQTALASVIANRAPSVAGADQEDLDGAAGRADGSAARARTTGGIGGTRYQSTTLDQIDRSMVRAIHAPSRAVNLLDIESLALNVPGTCVARAHAWPGVDAAYPCLRASGVVTLVIVPDLDVSKPLPSAGLISAVQHYLDVRRILCTRIVVAAPQYLTVTVTAQVALLRGASGTRVQQSVRDAIDAFLDPRTGGPQRLRLAFRARCLPQRNSTSHPGGARGGSCHLPLPDIGSRRRRMRQHHCLLDVVSHAGHLSNRDGMNNLLLNANGRIVWKEGQVLASRDLRGELDDDTRRRRLHNEYLHGTWGIALGFGVQLQAKGGSVIVSPGYAVDVEGRDLLLSQTLAIALPSEGMFVLVATYDAASTCKPTLPAADFCGGLDPRRERALIGWVAMADLNMGIHVPLARVVVTFGVSIGGLDLQVRHMARRMVRPHVGRGVTETGATNWVDANYLKTSNVWLQADIDTSDAGFLGAPRYFAALCRRSPTRRNPRAGSLDEATAAFADAPSFSLDILGTIIGATAQGFTYQLRRGVLPFGVDLTASEAEEGGWVVTWLGLETVAGCQPDFNLQLQLAVLGSML